MKCLRVLMAKTKNVQTMGLIAGLAAFLMVWMSAPVYGHEYRTDALIVKYKAGVTQAQTQAVNTKHKVITQENINRISAQSVTVNDLMPVELKIQELKSDPNVEYAEPDFQRSVSVTSPNDSYYYSYQWNMPKIRADYAWDSQRGSSNVIIAIVDTGVSLNHPDLSGKIVAGYDSVSHDGNPTDENGHGTHVAGIAAATTNNGVGVAGVSWNSRIMPVRVLDDSGNGWDSDIAEGIIWAADNGAKVINMSLGGTSSYPQTLQNAVNYAYARGVTIVAAAGNNPNGEIIYPAACANVIGVAATDSNDNRASFSNYGSFVDVAAPGVLVASTYWTAVSGNVYGTGSGTSMATPHVAGLAALILAGNPSWTPDWVEQVIESSAVDLGSPGRDDFYGYGRINAYGAINYSGLMVNHFEVETTTSQTAGRPFSVTVTAKDTDDAVMTEFVGPAALSDTSGTISLLNTGNFVNGEWTGNVTITKAGVTAITAKFGNPVKTGTSDAITVSPAAFDHVKINPTSARVPIGQTQAFTTSGYDAYNNPLANVVIDWTQTGGSINPLRGSSTTYTAGTQPGAAFTVTASSGGKSAQATVAVLGPLNHIHVSPASHSLPEGMTANFSAQGHDSADNVLTITSFNWTATGGTVNPANGLSTTFTAGTTLGTFQVSATSGAVAGQAAVTITKKPVYRFYKFRDGAHFYTANEAEKNAVLARPDVYTYEGVSFYAQSQQVSGTQPVYRFYNFINGVHFYTINYSEYLNVLNYGGWTFRFEGVAYYAYPTQAQGTVAVYRFYNFLQGVHFYTANQAEATNVNDNLWWTFRYEGIAYYVPDS